MRNIKTLLQIVLDNFSTYFNDCSSDGVCLVIQDLEYSKCITHTERCSLQSYIHDNPPSKTLYDRDSNFYGYYWKPGYAKPRLRWLRKHIKINN